ncbi:MAG TPA: hypothetical protein DF383_02990 [Deltaproteobacteria bacterium]|nr:hypothetical protein [Deltaproteobacteria bacterium]
MDRRDIDIVDFIYGELNSSESAEFQAQCREDSSLGEEIQALRRVAKIYRHRLPDVKPPSALVRQVLQKIQDLPQPKQRKAGFFSFASFWRPALTGTFVLALTLGGFYQYKQWRERSVPVALHQPKVQEPSFEPPVAADSGRGGDLSWADLAVAQPASLLPVRTFRPAPTLNAGALVTFASYGATPSMAEAFRPQEIYSLDQEAQFQVAQFSHQQAIRMHALGDHQGASEAIARLVKNYPNYPRLFEAMALRIGCLFEMNQDRQAEQELSWLRQRSPELAVLVERRWRN